MSIVERAAKVYEGSRIPSPIPTVLQIDPAEHALDDILTVNFGPNHPSTHGVLRLVVDLDGEHVAGIAAVIGYLHTGFEKTMEQKTWWKCITYPERIDYVSFQVNELAFVLAIEKLLNLEVPLRGQYLRVLFAELTRIKNHMLNLGSHVMDVGAMTPNLWLFELREDLMNFYERVSGARIAGPAVR